MPTKTKRDEEKWQKAKELAADAGKAENYAYIMGIYKKMKPDYEFKSGPEAKKASSPRVAYRFLKAASDAEDAAEAIFKSGTPPDADPWRGGPPVVRVSFTGIKALNTKTTPVGRATHVNTALTSDATKRADGIYADSYLFVRFSKAYPGQELALLNAFMRNIDPSKLTREIKQHYEDPRFGWHLLSDVFGYRETDEWENPTNVKVQRVVLGKRPTLNRGMHITWVAHVSFDAVKKAPESRTPFTDMDDRELNTWIERWEHEAPENFWMDGELQMPHRDALKMYRDQWRKMSPRDQMRTMAELEKQMHYASLTASHRGMPSEVGSSALLKRQGLTPVDEFFGEVREHNRPIVKSGEGVQDRRGKVYYFVGLDVSGKAILADNEREWKALHRQLVEDRKHVIVASASRVASRFLDS